ncbi:hypothetical protein PGIGA_G00109910 [Pangasianodon gigas]|uniref:Uncharacterized protein n=1 Tax=Pangasianodon gigas TaxID=30993 RepID=A0ACC5WAV4_PANGG|nr:hypothetical protein [Pangasianodon gigas]
MFGSTVPRVSVAVNVPEARKPRERSGSARRGDSESSCVKRIGMKTPRARTEQGRAVHGSLQCEAVIWTVMMWQCVFTRRHRTGTSAELVTGYCGWL